MKKLLIRLSLLIVLGAVAWGGYTALKKIPQTREAQIPFAKVRRGDVVRAVIDHSAGGPQ